MAAGQAVVVVSAPWFSGCPIASVGLWPPKMCSGLQTKLVIFVEGIGAITALRNSRAHRTQSEPGSG